MIFIVLQKFERGSERKFMMSTEKSLGDLTFMKIWHDNSGKGSFSSWYLDHIVITDLQTRQRYYTIRIFVIEFSRGS